jgi:hypothetical protein
LTIWVYANITARQIFTPLPGVTRVAGSVAFRRSAFVDVNATLPVQVQREAATTGALRTGEFDLAPMLTGDHLGDMWRTGSSINNIAQPGLIIILLHDIFRPENL